MKSRLVLLLVAAVAALALAGCSKEKPAEETAKLQAQVQQLEAQVKQLTDSMHQAGLQAETDKILLKENASALELRLMHQPATAFVVEPAGGWENGWLMLEGEHTFRLTGHEQASKVTFHWADGADLKAQQLGEDRTGKDGWSWVGILPSANTKAFWAEVHYPGGVTVKSAVLPIRSGGK